MENNYIDIHTHRPCDDSTVCVCSLDLSTGSVPKADGTYSAGIHPWRAGEEGVQNALRQMETMQGIVAIGEIGLDFVRGPGSDIQQEVFKAQLDIAQKRELPVVIHCVKAYNEVLQTLGRFRLKAVIFHAYIGSPQQSQELAERGYYFSIGLRSLDSPKTVESLRSAIPHERLFAETDDGDAGIDVVYSKLAAIMGVTLPYLKQKIAVNYKHIFR